MVTVVILPGLDGTGSLLEGFRASLAALGLTARVVGYPPDRALGYDELQPLVRAQLPAAGAFVLLGESFSGPLALQVAADPPEGLVGLVLSTTFARAPVRGLSRWVPLVRFAPARPPAALLSWLLLGPWATPELRAGLGAALAAVDPEVLRARAAAALRVDVSRLLGAIAVPVLQLVAGHDRLLAGTASRALAAGLASSRTVRVPGPHLLLQAATRPAAEAVAGFVQGLGRGGRSGPVRRDGTA